MRVGGSAILNGGEKHARGVKEKNPLEYCLGMRMLGTNGLSVYFWIKHAAAAAAAIILE